MITPSEITARLLIIDGLDISQTSDYKVSENKEVKSNTTNMLGDVRQTILGTRTTIDAQIRVSDRNELNAIITKLNKDNFDVTYWSVSDNTTRQAQFYCTGYDTELLDKSRGFYKPFSIQLASVSLR